MKFICSIFFLFLSYSTYAQFAVKVKKEDNRFLFFQKGIKNDTLIKNRTDLFYIKLPDSLKQHIQIFLQNGQFTATDNDTIYRLRPIPGMKYSHSKPDTIFNTLLEGSCTPSKNISIEFINTKTQQHYLKNNFIVK
ncbi:MAG: hypothetical protein V4677_08350 [Bacteroidota bacterium]